MKKICLIVFALFAVVLLLGCRPDVVTPPKPEAGEEAVAPAQVEEPEAAPEKAVKEVKEPVKTEEPEEKAEEEEAPGPAEPKVVVEDSEASSAELKELLRRADEKVTSYSYLYGGPETAGYFKDTYVIKGDKMLIKVYEEDYYVQTDYYDRMYIDFATKTATGCCVTRNRCISHNVDNTVKVFELDLNAISIPKTPYQWVKEITYATIVGPETFDERSVTAIKYTRGDGTEVRMKLDDTYGMPHQVVIMKGEQQIAKYQFNDMVFNAYKDAEFVPPCVK